MFVAAFLTFMAIGGFPSFVEDMKVRTLLCYNLCNMKLIMHLATLKFKL